MKLILKEDTSKNINKTSTFPYSKMKINYTIPKIKVTYILKALGASPSGPIYLGSLHGP